MTLLFWGFTLLRLLGFVFFILLSIKILSGIFKKRYNNTIEALNIAAQRFATGDITIDQYREIKSTLKA